MHGRRAALTDTLGLAFLLLVLVDFLRPSLLLLPTVTAGGDTPCHYPTFAYFYQYLLPSGRLHGWYPGAYLGHPLLLYYFPLPFLFMSALVPLVGMPAAFKLGTVLGVFLLPLLAYASFRLMDLRFPGPLLGAAASVVFLLLEENPIWGGTLASTLTGEFSYTDGIGLGVLFLGVVYRARARGAGPWLPAAALALTALAHGYAVLWAGLSAGFFLYQARRSVRTFAWLLAVAGLSFALAAFWLLPLVSGWGWTTPYDDPWITVELRNLFPPLLWPLLACALAGLVAGLVMRRRGGELDQRLLFLLHAALVGAALAAAGPALGIIDIRFVPFAQLAACLAGAVAIAQALELLVAPDLAALGLAIGLALYAEGQSRVLRSWIDWNYSGLEARELWPAYRALADQVRGGVADPRVAVEYGKEHERAGSIRMYETLPFFSGRSTLEGVYNQASVMTHPVYYLSSELGETSPNPFRSREYSSFDTENAVRHLRLLNVSEVVAISARLTAALAARPDFERVAQVRPYTLFRFKDGPFGYVEPLAFAPVRAPLRGWRDRCFRWFAWKPQGAVHLVFSDDPRLGPAHLDPWLPPPARRLDAGVQVSERVEREAVHIRTNRPGHPLLVKIAYHPRWTAEGADGPYLISPGLMMVIPRQAEVTLRYGRNWADRAGVVLTAAALGLGAVSWIRRRARRAGESPLPAAEDESARWHRGLRVLPAAVLLVLGASRVVVRPRDPAAEVPLLSERATRAYAAGRFDDAAEFARHALSWASGPERLAELRCLRGESLLRAGRAREAASEFDQAAAAGNGPHLAQAVSGQARALEAVGDLAAAAAARDRLHEQFSDTPWARRNGAR